MTEEEVIVSNHPYPPENLEAVPLSSSEEQFRLVLEASPDGFIILRNIRDAGGTIADFSIEYSNPVAARGVNRTPEELLGQPLLQLFPNCKTSGIFDRYVTVAETGNSETFETFYESKELTGWFRNVVVKLNDGIGVSFSNITDRKQAELALHQQEQHFKIALQTAKLGSWEHHLTTGVLTCSAQCKANFGLPPDAEFTHETLFAALHPDDRPLVQATIQRCIEERTDYEVEERCYHPDGSLHWLIVRGQLVYDAKGTPIRLVGVTLDITERKQTEIALRESQELFQSFMNHSPIAAFIKDETGRYLYANPWVERVYQRSRSELIGKTDFELLPPAIAQQFYRNDRAVLSDDQPMQMLETIHHEDREHTYMSFKFPFRNAAGQQVLAGVAIDISERIQAEAALQQREAELRLITNAVPVLIAFVDVEQRYRFNNQKYEEWFGQPAAEVKGKYLWEVLGQAAYETIRPAVEQVLAGQEVTFEQRIPYKKGGARDVLVNYIPRCDPQGNVEGFVALVTDITRRKQAEKTLQRYQLLSEHIRDIVLYIDRNGQILEANRAAEQVYGYSRAELLSLKISDLRASSTLPILAQQFDQAIREGILFETLHQRKDGSQFPVEVSAQSAVIDGEPAVLSTIRDITDRRRSEAALRRGEERFQLITKATNDVIWDCDLSTGEVWRSERMQLVFGYCPEEMEPNASSWAELVHPDDIERVRSSYELCLDQSATVWTNEYRFRRANGSYADVLDRAYIVRDAAGNALRVVGAMADITRRKQAEQALRESEEWARLAIQVGRLGGWRLHLDSNLVEMDERMREIWGEPEDTVIVPLPRVIKRMHPDDRERVASAVNAAIAPNSSGIYEIDYRIVWDDGTERWVSAKGQARFEGEGESRQTVDFFGTLLDITDRKQAEAALRNSAERLSVALAAAKLGDWSWSAATDIVTFSEQAAEMFGIPPGPYRTHLRSQEVAASRFSISLTKQRLILVSA
ncbi:PAS domain S-box protein (plasmid) [Kovacikia minuta CCNUW1]|uniref:bifunctional diguanylate cyclase/phosphodiesterase n=1 Tax=Kovacikia minuta TaxID=2931930 RepID=UPI001CCF52C1|nr:PAS domain S-box protein [Kovacikia minuta]UBF30489.1 PAS domain S-box protein [Kovacikia minuta CCNUW1]